MRIAGVVDAVAFATHVDKPEVGRGADIGRAQPPVKAIIFSRITASELDAIPRVLEQFKLLFIGLATMSIYFTINLVERREPKPTFCAEFRTSNGLNNFPCGDYFLEVVRK